MITEFRTEPQRKVESSHDYAIRKASENMRMRRATPSVTKAEKPKLRQVSDDEEDDAMAQLSEEDVSQSGTAKASKRGALSFLAIACLSLTILWLTAYHIPFCDSIPQAGNFTLGTHDRICIV